MSIEQRKGEIIRGLQKSSWKMCTMTNLYIDFTVFCMKINILISIFQVPSCIIDFGPCIFLIMDDDIYLGTVILYER